MSLKIIFETPKTLKNILDSIASNLTEGIYLEFTSSGLQLHINVSGGIWAVESKISKEKFYVYELKDDVVMQLRYKELSDFVKTTGSEDSLIMELDDEKNRVTLTLEKENTKRSMELGLLGVQDYRFKNLANFTDKYKGKFTISTTLYQQSIKTVELGGSHVRCSMDKEKISLISEGTNRSAKVEILSDNEELQNYSYEEAENEIVSHFGIEYLQNLTKFSKISDSMLMCVGSKMPILCIFQNSDVDFVAIAIAPRNE